MKILSKCPYIFINGNVMSSINVHLWCLKEEINEEIFLLYCSMAEQDTSWLATRGTRLVMGGARLVASSRMEVTRLPRLAMIVSVWWGHEVTRLGMIVSVWCRVNVEEAAATATASWWRGQVMQPRWGHLMRPLYTQPSQPSASHSCKLLQLLCLKYRHHTREDHR